MRRACEAFGSADDTFVIGVVRPGYRRRSRAEHEVAFDRATEVLGPDRLAV